ncbi:MAG TPA: tRNA uridine-5-carboxymethylaminomethyl(34) synthesis GTPase MnmE [Methyloceanibacter sp.]|nr:tRNA uridine-5-carboxymethylaminomethyl(34) synthesis GTPase MnmE [Methyloceanibacter sp.]
MDQEIGQSGKKSEATVVSPDTIVALASGAMPAAIAVVRISGPRTRNVLEAFGGGVPEARHAALRDIGPPRLPAIDRGLVIWFPGPASFTGEDMAELHTHGSRAVVGEVMEAVLSLDGTRLAEPGEFARRAFENGKLDLTQVEGLADLISAETEAQRRQALAQAEGSLRALYEGWRAELLRAQTFMEAGLDFADEGDVVADVALKAEAIVTPLLISISHHLADRRGERLRDGVRIVIAGRPNVGKSSLLNALAKRDVAIVSEEAGTTRDVLEVHLDLGALPVILSDTAGLRDTASKVEAEGVRRALSRTEQADVVLWLVDATAPVWDPPVALGTKPAVIGVLNKIDLAPHAVPPRQCVQISAKTGQGFDGLIEALEEHATMIAETGAGSPLMTRARHRAELEGARAALQRFGDPSLSPELKAEELRIAARHLGRLTGRINVEEVLGAIFGEFCIGK